MAIKFDNVVSAIPAVDATKAGQTFFYKGEMWRYLTEGETGLPAGTPWPSKGYKELSINIFYSGFDMEATIVGVITNQLGVNPVVESSTAIGYRIDFLLPSESANRSILLCGGYFNTGDSSISVFSSTLGNFADSLVADVVHSASFEGEDVLNLRQYPPSS